MGTAIEGLAKGMTTANEISGALNKSIDDTNKTIGSMGGDIKNLSKNVNDLGLIGNDITSMKTNIANLDKSVGGNDIHSKLAAIFDLVNAASES